MTVGAEPDRGEEVDEGERPAALVGAALADEPPADRELQIEVDPTRRGSRSASGSYWIPAGDRVADERDLGGGGAAGDPAAALVARAGAPTRTAASGEQCRTRAHVASVSGEPALPVEGAAAFSSSRACMIRSRRSCGLLTPMKLNWSDGSSLAVSKSIEPTFMIRSTGDCLTVMFWIRSTLVELSVFERIPRRMLSRLVVIVYCVKKRSIQPAMIVSPIPTMRTSPMTASGVDAEPAEEGRSPKARA